MTPLKSATPHWNIPQPSSHLLFYLINTLCRKQRWAASIVGSSRPEPHGKSRHHSKEPFSRAGGQCEPEDEGVSKASGGGGGGGERFILCPICMGFHWQEVFPTPEEEFSHIADPRGERGCPRIILASWRRSVFLPYICSSFCSWCLPLTALSSPNFNVKHMCFCKEQSRLRETHVRTRPEVCFPQAQRLGHYFGTNFTRIPNLFL